MRLEILRKPHGANICQSRGEPLFQWISALAPLSKRSNGARKKKENGFSLLLWKRKDGSARGLSDVAFNGDRRQKITLAVAFFVDPKEFLLCNHISTVLYVVLVPKI